MDLSRTVSEVRRLLCRKSQCFICPPVFAVLVGAVPTVGLSGRGMVLTNLE